MGTGHKRNDYFSFQLGRKDDTILTEDEFLSEHQDIRITYTQKKRMFENIERQAILFLREYGIKKIDKISGHCKNFTFIDEKTKELYFRPLYEIDLRVFFKNKFPLLLIYDIRRFD